MFGESLNNELSIIKTVILKSDKIIYSLPDNLVYVVKKQDAFNNIPGVKEGFGHEPEFLNKMLEFYMNSDQIYVEVGVNYGDFALQISKKLDTNGRIYAFEPSLSVFNCFQSSIVLNNIKNIKAEHMAILDYKTEVSFSDMSINSVFSEINFLDNNQSSSLVRAESLDNYFFNKEPNINIIRIDAEGSECKILKGAERIIDSSPDIRLIIEWHGYLLKSIETENSKRECLNNLVKKGFIFFDIENYDNNCSSLLFKLNVSDIISAHLLNFIAIREETFKKFNHNDYSENLLCIERIEEILLSSASLGMIDRTKYLFDLASTLNIKVDLNKILPIGGSVLHLAAEYGYPEMTKLLINKGADITIKANNHLTPLCIAAQTQNSDVVRVLINNNADIECKFPSGATPLYISSYLGDVKSAILLLKANASDDVIVENFNIIDRAKLENRTEIEKLLTLGVEDFCSKTNDIQYMEVCGRELSFTAEEL